MKPRKPLGWALIGVAVALMLFGDFGTVTRLSIVLVNIAAMAVLAVGLVLAAT